MFSRLENNLLDLYQIADNALQVNYGSQVDPEIQQLNNSIKCIQGFILRANRELNEQKGSFDIESIFKQYLENNLDFDKFIQEQIFIDDGMSPEEANKTFDKEIILIDEEANRTQQIQTVIISLSESLQEIIVKKQQLGIIKTLHYSKQLAENGVKRSQILASLVASISEEVCNGEVGQQDSTDEKRSDWIQSNLVILEYDSKALSGLQSRINFLLNELK